MRVLAVQTFHVIKVNGNCNALSCATCIQLHRQFRPLDSRICLAWFANCKSHGLSFQILESEVRSKSCRRSKERRPFSLVYHARAHNCVSSQELLICYEHIIQTHRYKCSLRSILNYKPCHISQMKCSIRRVPT